MNERKHVLLLKLDLIKSKIVFCKEDIISNVAHYFISRTLRRKHKTMLLNYNFLQALFARLFFECVSVFRFELVYHILIDI